jgi:hypothetical protein
MIIILGCDHCLQDLPEDMGPFWQEISQTPRAHRQQEGFLQTMDITIREHGCSLIGEETDHGRMTPAERVVESLGIRYQNIEMTAAERVAAGIPPAGYDDDPNSSNATKETWHRLREQHMIREIQQARRDDENVLIICGVRHMLPLSEHFQSSGEHVISVNVTSAEWFSGPLMTDWLFEKQE